METETLRDLLERLEEELKRIGYSEEGTLPFYRYQWKHLLLLAEERGEAAYSKNLGERFLEMKCRATLDEVEIAPADYDRRKRRIIRMIDYFIESGKIINHYHNGNTEFHGSNELDSLFKNYCIQKNRSRVTIQYYTKYIRRFLNFLSSTGVSSYMEIDVNVINEYFLTLEGYTQKTMNNYTTAIDADVL